MVLDTSVMNVAISQIVEDLDTTIPHLRPNRALPRSVSTVLTAGDGNAASRTA